VNILGIHYVEVAVFTTEKAMEFKGLKHKILWMKSKIDCFEFFVDTPDNHLWELSKK